MTTTHPYPALPMTNEQRHPEHYRDVNWNYLLNDGCPRCGCDSFQEWSECYGLHDIEIEADYDSELDEATAGKVIACWDTHTDMLGDSSIRCRGCDLEIHGLDYRDITYA